METVVGFILTCLVLLAIIVGVAALIMGLVWWAWSTLARFWLNGDYRDWTVYDDEG